MDMGQILGSHKIKRAPTSFDVCRPIVLDLKKNVSNVNKQVPKYLSFKEVLKGSKSAQRTSMSLS